MANPALPNFTLTKLLWVKRAPAGVLCADPACSVPEGLCAVAADRRVRDGYAGGEGTLLLDVAHRRWSREVAEAAGIPMAWLPRLFEGPEICARVSAEGAAATGLKAGTPVVAGAGDQGAGAVGMGMLTPGSVSATIGTSGVVFASTDKPTMDPMGRLHTFCHAAPGLWHVMGVTNGAGLSLRWLRIRLRRESYDELTVLAADVPAGSDGLMWAPYLFGERTPHLDPRRGRRLWDYGFDHAGAFCAGGDGGCGAFR